MKSIALPVVLCWAASSVSAAWVRPAGEGYLQLGASYTSAAFVYDSAGTKQSTPRFTEMATQVAGEYGVTGRYTLGYLLPFVYTTSAEDTALLQTSRSATGLGDSILANRFQLVNGPVLLSVGLDLGLPTGNKAAAIPLGDGEVSVLPKLMLGGGFTAGLPGFYLVSAGYHKRTIGFSDEFHAGAMGGLTAGMFTFIVSVELRQSLRNGDAGNLSASPLLYNNASFASWSLGSVFKPTDRLQFMAFYKGGLYVRNFLGAASFSLAAGYAL